MTPLTLILIAMLVLSFILMVWQKNRLFFDIVVFLILMLLLLGSEVSI